MHDELLGLLEAFEIDRGQPALPFHRRLAHENGWSAAHAQRVIAEYKRFLWLAMRAGHPVTPSPAVDEAWHLHLCYTRSYWDELCAKVLARPLHHGPTLGGADEDAKYHDWYARTLASYSEHFGEPPADIWPPVERRFLGGIPRRVDARTHWVVSKRTLGWVALAGGAAVLVASCRAETGENVLVLLLVLLLLGALLAVVNALLGRKRHPRRRSGESAGPLAGCAVTGCGAAGCGSTSKSGGCGHDGGDSGGGASGGDAGGASGCGGGGCGGGGCGGGGD